MELFENTKINQYIIELIDNKQPFYRPIYTLSLVELEILKIYIKTHFKISFIQSSQFLTGDLILSDKKPDSSLYLWVNYQGLNNLTIKNQYPLPLIGEFFH